MKMSKIKNYLKIARFDHWIKQLFIIPGWFVAVILTKSEVDLYLICILLFSLIGTSLVASANYVINEWLDARFDAYHPVKKNRPVVTGDIDKKIVFIEYFIFAIAGLFIMYLINKYMFFVGLILLMMGIIYNVKPFRTKEVVYLDVLSESINNALRFLVGWFAVTVSYFPPVSIVFGYWMAGAFLMATKRFAEYKMINDKKTASLYRKSFKYYTEISLLLYSFFFALLSSFFLGIFLVKYRIELVIFIPFMIGLYCYYFYLAFKSDSAVQKPEKLYKEKGLMIYILFLIILFVILMMVDIPILGLFTRTTLLPI